MGKNWYLDDQDYAKKAELIDGSLTITPSAPPPPPGTEPKKAPTNPNFSWRFGQTDSDADIPNVYYYIPARRIDANIPIGSKQSPWGVDCYAIGRLLYDILNHGTLDKLMKAEAAAVVSFCKVLWMKVVFSPCAPGGQLHLLYIQCIDACRWCKCSSWLAGAYGQQSLNVKSMLVFPLWDR